MSNHQRLDDGMRCPVFDKLFQSLGICPLKRVVQYLLNSGDLHAATGARKSALYSTENIDFGTISCNQMFTFSGVLVAILVEDNVCLHWTHLLVKMAMDGLTSQISKLNLYRTAVLKIGFTVLQILLLQLFNDTTTPMVSQNLLSTG
ncbi:hypothetical protein CEXT_752501 [Caerostris extrusa]|uniref:Uncharacterized protein n=1 Tax=Caerostris extrusa TaxID=172846 RepID=A0AAV4N0Z3_CAEEX|nr:hypothetical protein CEXT_752501 [Caerostris extrusa]